MCSVLPLIPSSCGISCPFSVFYLLYGLGVDWPPHTGTNPGGLLYFWSDQKLSLSLTWLSSSSVHLSINYYPQSGRKGPCLRCQPPAQPLVMTCLSPPGLDLSLTRASMLSTFWSPPGTDSSLLCVSAFGSDIWADWLVSGVVAWSFQAMLNQTKNTWHWLSFGTQHYTCCDIVASSGSACASFGLLYDSTMSFWVYHHLSLMNNFLLSLLYLLQYNSIYF